MKWSSLASCAHSPVCSSSAAQPDRRGQYSIEGYTLTLRYDSGRVERRLIVADPADTKTLWLDGDVWVRR